MVSETFSVLGQIIRRLQIMTYSNQTEVRRFEANGVPRAIVTYNPDSGIYTMEDTVKGKSFDFDKIDLVAIEIYELLS